ncbi:MAG: LD-carboxypeptidase [Thermoanaerobaculia bacterium]
MKSPPRLPPPLRPGDRVGVAALSGPVDADRLAAGVDALASLGYRPVEAANLRSRTGLFAGGDDERLDAFHQLAADPEVRAIVFARGGWGVLRILPRIDWDLLACHPRAYVGYSDLTPFLLQVVARLGLVAFHGPMVAADLARGLAADERTSLMAALGGAVATTHDLGWCAGGEAAEGALIGGCLSLLTSTLGTAFAPDLEDAILFFEDVDEPPYRVDRMLTHLRLSGSLSSLQGMIAGHLTCDIPVGPTPAGRTPVPRNVHAPAAEPSNEDLVRELAGGVDWPVAWGLCAGHSSPNLTLPLGARVRLDPGRRTLEVLSPAGA